MYYQHNTSREIINWEPSDLENWTRISAKQGEAAIRAQAIAWVRKICPPGTRVYCTLRKVSRSGMMRHISMAVIEDGALRDITWLVADIIGERMDRDTGGIRVSGCGMDMGFHLVYSLGRALYPRGFGVAGELPDARRVQGFRKVRAKTPAEAARLVAKGATFRGRNGDSTGWDNDGGYSLRREWN